MAELKVNLIVNKTDSGPPELSYGAIIPSGQVISSSGGMNVVGVVTATSFVGDGTQLLRYTSPSKAYAIKLVMDLPFRS